MLCSRSALFKHLLPFAILFLPTTNVLAQEFELCSLPVGTLSTAEKINDLGEVLGTAAYADGSYSLFYWNGSAQNIPQAVPSLTGDLNNLGEVTGSMTGNTAFRWSPSLDLPEDLTPAVTYQCIGRGINSFGHVAVSCIAGELAYIHDGSSLLPLDYTGYQGARPYGINEIGEVVGQVWDLNGDSMPAVLSPSSSARILDVLPYSTGIAYVTDKFGSYLVGTVTGSSSPVTRGAIWSGVTGQLIDAVPEIYGSANPTYLYNVNLSGEAVGTGLGGAQGIYGIYYKNGQSYDLNSLIQPQPATEHIVSAADINESGQIACEYWNYWLGDTTACVLTPKKTFVRGDVNADGLRDISDMIFILQYLFQGSSVAVPLDALDVNDDGSLNVSDVAFLSNAIFSGQAIPEPSVLGQPGTDPTHDCVDIHK